MTKKVLIVDDAETVLRAVIEALEPAGFEVLTATDGLRGIALLKVTLDLSLVIVDLNMPGMSGLGVLEWMQRDGSPHLPPAVVMTTEVAPSQVERAKQAGALGWLVKPCPAQRLVAVANKLSAKKKVVNGN